MPSKATIDIVIPSYNAFHLLEKNLPSVIKYSGDFNKIIVVDDGSTDETKEKLAKHFPEVVCIRHEKNSGFSVSVNQGVSFSKADYIVLLNNDVYVNKDYLVSPLKYLNKDSHLFAINFNETSSSWPKVWWGSGKMQFTRAEDKSKTFYCAWPSGGSAILRRSTWEDLGGLNEIYSPAYWEDIDLGWRAWKAGYKIIWVPDSSVVHDHESTFGLLDKNFLNNLKQTNELVFTWQNFSDIKLRISHYWFLLSYTALHPGYLKIIIRALLKYTKGGHLSKGIVTDHEIFSTINKEYEN